MVLMLWKIFIGGREANSGGMIALKCAKTSGIYQPSLCEGWPAVAPMLEYIFLASRAELRLAGIGAEAGYSV